MNLPTLKPITNRDSKTGKYSLPADGFYQLAPKGEFPHQPTKMLQVIDEEAITAMVNRFNEDARGPGFVGALVDYEHFSYDTDKKTEAAGWITALENRADGLYAKIDWTPDAQAELESGKYRFISPTWLSPDVKALGNRKVRPLRLDRAGLTNTPRLEGIAPLSNSNRSGVCQGELHQGAAWENDNNNMQKLALMAAALGLAATASEDAVLAGVTELKNRATTLETENKDLREAQVEADLAKYANRYAPEKKESIKAALIANRKSTIEILEMVPERAATAPAKAPMHNRATAKAPEKSPAGATGDIYAKQNAEVKAYMNRNNVDFDSAFQAVMAEKPELFPADDASE